MIDNIKKQMKETILKNVINLVLQVHNFEKIAQLNMVLLRLSTRVGGR